VERSRQSRAAKSGAVPWRRKMAAIETIVKRSNNSLDAQVTKDRGCRRSTPDTPRGDVGDLPPPQPPAIGLGHEADGVGGALSEESVK
jgi:hypothetical protein